MCITWWVSSLRQLARIHLGVTSYVTKRSTRFNWPIRNGESSVSSNLAQQLADGGGVLGNYGDARLDETISQRRKTRRKKKRLGEKRMMWAGWPKYAVFDAECRCSLSKAANPAPQIYSRRERPEKAVAPVPTNQKKKKKNPNQKKNKNQGRSKLPWTSMRRELNAGSDPSPGNHRFWWGGCACDNVKTSWGTSGSNRTD